MLTPTDNELKHLVIDWIKQNKLPTDYADLEITPNTDLMASGLLDSLGFVELIQFIEIQIGCQIDLMDVAPDEFTAVKDLCNIALRSCYNGNGTLRHEGERNHRNAVQR
jgi:acyl carrier protein